MLADLTRAGARITAAPVRALTRGVRRALTRGGRILELHLDRVPDVRQRAILVERVRRVALDPGVVGLLIRIDAAPGGWAATGDLRAAILHVRASGKRVFAALESPGNAAMWLASACDHVALVPTGEVAPLGVGAELTFFGAALERLGVQPDFEAAGAYKAFGEPFTRSFASAENREATSHLLEGLHVGVLDDIAEGRGIDRAELERRACAGVLGPSEALALGLVDSLAYPDELDARFVAEGADPPARLSFDAWARADFVEHTLDAVGRGPKAVAILHLEGPIVLDRGRGAHISVRRTVDLVRALRRDDRVAAVVLNVSSPGGHALGSDLLWRELDRLAADKPLVAAYEDVSASGGVYLSAPAKRIFARPGTITGSVGVFGGKLVLGEGMRRVGVHTQVVGAAESASYLSASRPFTDAQRARFRAHLQRFYDGFVERVASGRGKDVDAIEPSCRGRVWTGAQAVERGLVDEIGDLSAAVRHARALAGLGQGSGILHASAIPRASVLQWAVARAAPGAFGAPAAFALLGLDALDRLAGLFAEPGQALALLPFDLRLR
jgi:protease-4